MKKEKYQPEVIIKYKEAEPFIVDCYCKYLYDLFNNSGLFDDCFGENRVDYKKRYYDRLKENQIHEEDKIYKV